MYFNWFCIFCGILLCLELTLAGLTTKDAEFVRVNLKDNSGLKQAAIEKGMDPDAVEELLTHKNTVTKTSIDADGNTRTETYFLTPNGGISRKISTDYKPKLISTKYFKEPWTSTANFDDQTRPKPKLENDWEWNPQGNPFEQSPFRPTYTRTWQSETPIVYRPPGMPSGWPSYGHFNPQKPTQPEEKEETVPTTTAKIPESWYRSRSWPFGQSDINPFFDMDTNTPGTVTKTSVDENGNTITTTYKVGPTKWTTRTFEYPFGMPETPISAPPNVPATVVTTTPKTEPTTTTTTTSITPQPIATTPSTTKDLGFPTTTPLPSLEDFLNKQYTSTTQKNKAEPGGIITTTKLPSLEDFLRSQYGSPTTPKTTSQKEKEREPTTPKTTSQKEKEREPTTPKTTPKTNQSAGSTTTPKPTTTTNPNPSLHTPILDPEEKIDITAPAEPPTAYLPPSVITPPSDPNMQDILRKAGITPDDIKASNGEPITKTSVQPDGSTITTTYRLRTSSNPAPIEPFVPLAAPPAPLVPVAPITPYRPYNHWFEEPTSPGINPYRPYRPTLEEPDYTSIMESRLPPYPGYFPQLEPRSSYMPRVRNPIESFLSKLGIALADIESTGFYEKTIKNDDGRTLTARFTLSIGGR